MSLRALCLILTLSQMADLLQRLNHFLRAKPTRGEGVFIAPGAVVVGDVTIGDRSSVWFNAALRGDINRIVIGHDTNVQDCAVLHVAEAFECQVGNGVTIGHSAIVHAATVQDACLVGMGAIILDGAVIGEESLVGAGALVTQGMKVPPRSLVLGSPARVVRVLTPEEVEGLHSSARKYVETAKYYGDNRKNRPDWG